LPKGGSLGGGGPFESTDYDSNIVNSSAAACISLRTAAKSPRACFLRSEDCEKAMIAWRLGSTFDCETKGELAGRIGWVIRQDQAANIGWIDDGGGDGPGQGVRGSAHAG